MSLTGLRRLRSAVNSASACPIVVRMSRSLCWMRSGVRISAAYVSGEISRNSSGSSNGVAPKSRRAHSTVLMSPVSMSIAMSDTLRQVMAARNRWSCPTIQFVR